MNRPGAKRRDTDLRDFACGACSHRSLAVVIGVGTEGGPSASDNATLTLSLARCPACGQRDPVAVSGFWARRVGLLVAGALLLWGFGAMLSLLVDDPVFLWIFGPLGFAVAPAMSYSESWKWTTVDRRVVFVDANVICRSDALSSPASLLPGR